MIQITTKSFQTLYMAVRRIFDTLILITVFLWMGLEIFYLLSVRMKPKLKTRQTFFMEKNRYVMMESIYRKQFYQ